MMLSGVPTLFEVGKDSMGIDQRQPLALSLLHHTDTPVHICRMAILQVVWILFGNIRADIKCLMTDQHALLE